MNPQKKLQQLDQVKLSEQEKSFLWLRIKEDIATNDIEVVEPKIANPLQRFARYLTYSLTPIMVIGFVMIGSANALPGQQLYGVKTGFNEELQRLTTFGSENKIELEKRLLTKRVKEARELRELGKLDIETAENIKNQITKQANKIAVADITDPAQTASTASDNDSDSEPKPSLIDEANVTKELALAELRGTANGSREAVDILAGNESASTTAAATTVEGSVEDDSNSSNSGLLQPYNATEPTAATKETTKVKMTIQAEAKVATTKAEVTQDVTDIQTEKDDDTKAKASDAARKKVEAAKETTNKNLEEVDEIELLDAVEEASAALTITQSLFSED